MTVHDRWFGLACAILAVPWTLVAFRLFTDGTERGTSPHLRTLVYIVAGLLNLWALMGMLL